VAGHGGEARPPEDAETRTRLVYNVAWDDRRRRRATAARRGADRPARARLRRARDGCWRAGPEASRPRAAEILGGHGSPRLAPRALSEAIPESIGEGHRGGAARSRGRGPSSPTRTSRAGSARASRPYEAARREAHEGARPPRRRVRGSPSTSARVGGARGGAPRDRSRPSDAPGLEHEARHELGGARACSARNWRFRDDPRDAAERSKAAVPARRPRRARRGGGSAVRTGRSRVATARRAGDGSVSAPARAGGRSRSSTAASVRSTGALPSRRARLRRTPDPGPAWPEVGSALGPSSAALSRRLQRETRACLTAYRPARRGRAEPAEVRVEAAAPRTSSARGPR